MKVTLMQLYLFPYLGYFQLVSVVDTFVFADDVNFIKGRFINRNKILHQTKDYYVTVPCGNNQNKIINEVQVSFTLKIK